MAVPCQPRRSPLMLSFSARSSLMSGSAFLFLPFSNSFSTLQRFPQPFSIWTQWGYWWGVASWICYTTWTFLCWRFYSSIQSRWVRKKFSVCLLIFRHYSWWLDFQIPPRARQKDMLSFRALGLVHMSIRLMLLNHVVRWGFLTCSTLWPISAFFQTCHVYANFWVVDLWVRLPDGLKSKDWASMLYSLRLKSSTPSWSIVFPHQPWPCLHSRWVFVLYLFRGERVQQWQLNQILLDTCTTLRWAEGYLEWVTA